ncbi:MULTISPECIES: hypothetical protein [unclassified Marinitoga]|uniref:hypothetical protein n=1 Tax=unclassified Marinitoga TaxID=2640159 RepID=UPI0006415A32|nr:MULTISPECIES: hypothetical protein [unclassified Marinitoga]KLO21162.1 hypothetical protein X274_11220 [Marinitoga sp. 1155]NUV00214.1 hypothetical protein [Marinitoga sp. 1154]
MKKVLLIIVIVFITLYSFSNNFTYSFGLELSGTFYPFIGVYYNMDKLKLGGSLGFICAKNDKISTQWNFLFSPSINIGYYLTDDFLLQTNIRAIIVFPYQNEQLYLAGFGAKYSIPITNYKLNIALSGNFILPLSAGKKAYERKKFYPIPFILGEYEF